MKVKKFNKRLVLNKNTIAHLDNDDMNAINGGYTLLCQPTGFTYCITRCVTDCACPTDMPTKCYPC